MANQTLTQLTQSTSASTGDVFYIVTNYESGNPTLTGDSKQIYLSAITNSVSGVTLSNNIDNAILTARGSKPELNGEVKLTFDGSNLNLTGNTTSTGLGNFGSLQVGSELTGGTVTGITIPLYYYATKTSAQVFGASTTLINGWSTLYTNNVNAFNTTTGVFTTPRTSTYRFTVTLTLTGTTASSSNAELTLSVSAAGVTRNTGNWRPQTTVDTGRKQLSLVAYVFLNINESAFINLLNSTGVSQGNVTTPRYTSLIIEEIPQILTN